MIEKNPSPLRKIFVDMIPVILGILIALLINSWKEKIDNEEFVQSTLSAISEELKENKEDLESNIPKHERMIDTIYHHLEDELTIEGILTIMEGFQIVSIKNTAWRSFLNQNIRLIDYSVVSALTDIEELKQSMNISSAKLLDFVYENANSADESKKRLFMLIIADFSGLENDILKDHIEALEAIRKMTEELE